MAVTYRGKDANISQGVSTASVAVSVGDALYQDASTNKLLPASSYTWDTDLATTQGTFKDRFAGIAQTPRLATQTDTPTVSLIAGGEFEVDCAALGAASPEGTFWGLAKQSGNLLENQKWAVVANATLAIAKQTRNAASGATKVWVRVYSTIYGNGVQTVT